MVAGNLLCAAAKETAGPELGSGLLPQTVDPVLAPRRYPQVWGETVLFRSEYWLRLNPWSPQALVAGLISVVMAVAIRTVLASFGVDLYFAPFLPAVLLASLIAGVPAGIFTALSAIVIVWWAFMPPAFEFGPLDRDDIDRFQLFLLGVSVLIWFSHLCRMVARMRAQ
jgi:H+/Cl- antiporter ClcA